MAPGNNSIFEISHSQIDAKSILLLYQFGLLGYMFMLVYLEKIPFVIEGLVSYCLRGRQESLSKTEFAASTGQVVYLKKIGRDWANFWDVKLLIFKFLGGLVKRIILIWLTHRFSIKLLGKRFYLTLSDMLI